MCYIELKNDKYETSEDLKHLLQYILRWIRQQKIVKERIL